METSTEVKEVGTKSLTKVTIKARMKKVKMKNSNSSGIRRTLIHSSSLSLTMLLMKKSMKPRRRRMMSLKSLNRRKGKLSKRQAKAES